MRSICPECHEGGHPHRSEVAVRSFRSRNSKDEINTFLNGLKVLEDFSLSRALFCMEHTGIYNNPLLECLHKKKVNICLEAASQIKNSLGNLRGKNDKIDAIRIG